MCIIVCSRGNTWFMLVIMCVCFLVVSVVITDGYEHKVALILCSYVFFLGEIGV